MIPCRYFGRPGGCHRGDACWYHHDTSACTGVGPGTDTAVSSVRPVALEEDSGPSPDQRTMTESAEPVAPVAIEDDDDGDSMELTSTRSNDGDASPVDVPPLEMCAAVFVAVLLQQASDMSTRASGEVLSGERRGAGPNPTARPPSTFLMPPPSSASDIDHGDGVASPVGHAMTRPAHTPFVHLDQWNLLQDTLRRAFAHYEHQATDAPVETAAYRLAVSMGEIQRLYDTCLVSVGTYGRLLAEQAVTVLLGCHSRGRHETLAVRIGLVDDGDLRDALHCLRSYGTRAAHDQVPDLELHHRPEIVTAAFAVAQAVGTRLRVI